jgi:hypothetical protein
MHRTDSRLPSAAIVISLVTLSSHSAARASP